MIVEGYSGGAAASGRTSITQVFEAQLGADVQAFGLAGGGRRGDVAVARGGLAGRVAALSKTISCGADRGASAAACGKFRAGRSLRSSTAGRSAGRLAIIFWKAVFQHRGHVGAGGAQQWSRALLVGHEPLQDRFAGERLAAGQQVVQAYSPGCRCRRGDRPGASRRPARGPCSRWSPCTCRSRSAGRRRRWPNGLDASTMPRQPEVEHSDRRRGRRASGSTA